MRNEGAESEKKVENSGLKRKRGGRKGLLGWGEKTWVLGDEWKEVGKLS